MFNLHSIDIDLCYKTQNVYCETKHLIFFICDPPHLMKTARNCFSRGNLWSNGQAIDWNFIVHLYQRNLDTDSGIFLVPKLKRAKTCFSYQFFKNESGFGYTGS